MADEAPQPPPAANEQHAEFFAKLGNFLDQHVQVQPQTAGKAKVSGLNMTLFGFSLSALLTTGYSLWSQARTDYAETKSNIKITADCAKTAEKSCAVIADNTTVMADSTTVMAELLREMKASNDRDGKKIEDIHRATAARAAAPSNDQ